MKNLSLLFLILLMLSCTKFGKNITVKGFVLNPITGQGIEGIEVSLLKTKQGLPGGLKAVKTVYTDAEGCYELNKYGLSQYSVRAQVGDRYNIGWFVNGEYLESSTGLLGVKKRKTMHADFHAVEYGNYSIEINNVNCLGPSDTIIIHQQNQLNTLLGVNWTLTGCNGYTTSFTKTPMGNVFTKYTVIRNNTSQVFYDTIFVEPNVNTTQVINY